MSRIVYSTSFIISLKNRIHDALRVLKLEDITPVGNKGFVLQIKPFVINAFLIKIEYMDKIDMIRISSSVSVDKKVQEYYKSQKEDDKTEIRTLFAKKIREHGFSNKIPKDFSELSGFIF